jgi:hypothetical protein
MRRDPTCTFHPWPPPGRTGDSRTLAGWWVDHTPGRDVRVTQVLPERDGSRILTLTGAWRTS